MASNIDPTKPSGTQAFGANLRANLAAAKDEIEALQTAASGNMAGFEASDTFRVNDDNVTYSQSVHGDSVAFLFQSLSADRTLTLPAEEGRGGAMIFVRVRISLDFQVTVRIEDPNNLGNYFEQPVANDFVRVIRKSADSGPGNPQFWDHFALHQSGAREPVSWLDQRPNLTVPEGADKLLIRDASDEEAPKLITLDNLGFAGGGGQSWTNGGAFAPNDVDLTSLTIFDPYTQTGTINWAVAASPVTGGTAIVRFTSNGGTLNWGSSFVAVNPQETLPASLDAGGYLLFFQYMPDWGGPGTNRVVVSISLGGLDNTAINMMDKELRRPDLRDFAETRSTPSIVGGAVTVDYEGGNTAVITLNANITGMTLINPPASGKIGSLTIWLAQDGTGGRTVTWPGSVDWGDLGAPTIAGGANQETIVTLVTRDGGTSWKGMLGWKKA